MWNRATIPHYFVVALILASSAQQAAGRPVILTKTNDIEDLRSVQQAIDSLARQAAACKSPGMACACGLRAGLDRLSAAYRAVVTKHPTWNEPDVVVQYVDSQHITHATALPNVKRQLDACHVR